MKGVSLVPVVFMFDRTVLTEVLALIFLLTFTNGSVKKPRWGCGFRWSPVHSSPDLLYDVPWEEILADVNSRK